MTSFLTAGLLSELKLTLLEVPAYFPEVCRIELTASRPSLRIGGNWETEPCRTSTRPSSIQCAFVLSWLRRRSLRNNPRRRLFPAWPLLLICSRFCRHRSRHREWCSGSRLRRAASPSRSGWSGLHSCATKWSGPAIPRACCIDLPCCSQVVTPPDSQQRRDKNYSGFEACR